MTPIPVMERSHGEARRLLASGAPVWLPVDPQEYHGPHLSLHNDGLVAAGLLRDTHARLAARHDWPLLVVPDLGVGTGVVEGPGSRPVPFAAVRGLVLRACDAVADLGARAVVLMTFHGDPRHNLALEQGVRHLRARGVRAFAPMHLLLRELMALDPALFAPVVAAIPAPADRRAALDGLADDIHAGFAETSLTLHYAPETVSPTWREVPPCPAWPVVRSVALAARAARAAGRETLARELDYAARGLGWLRLRPFPGYTGRPHLANEASGAVLAALLSERFAAAAEDVLVNGADPPPPVMAWLSVAGR